MIRRLIRQRPGRRRLLHLVHHVAGRCREFAGQLRGLLLFWRFGVNVESGVVVDNPGDVTVLGSLRLCRGARVRTSGPGSVVFGPGVVVCSNTTIEAAGGSVLVGANIVVGEYSTLQGQGGLVLEDNVLLASHVHFITNRHLYEDPSVPVRDQGDRSSPILIRENSWIGVNVTILPGVTVGRNSVVGSGSIVRQDVPDRCVAVGAPARVVRRHDPETGKWIRA